MSTATVVTQGFGTFGTVNLVVTDGYGVGEAEPEPEVVAPRGGKGDNQKRKTLHLPVKPLGLLDRPYKTKKAATKAEERIEETLKFQAEIAGRFARELREEIDAYQPPVKEMSLREIEAEIGTLLRKKVRSDEDEVMLLLLMAAAVAA